MMKRIKVLFISVSVLMIMLMMVGCGEETTAKYTSKEIYDAVTSAMKDMPEMTVVDEKSEDAEELYSFFSDAEYDKIKGYVFAYSTEGYADEVIVVEVKDSDDVSELKEDLQQRLETRKGTFATYNTDEGTKFQGATVLAKDNYVVLLIGNQAQNGKYEFNKLFE